MKIYNITNQVQEIRFLERGSSRYKTLYVCAHSSTDIDNNMILPDLETLIKKGIFAREETPVKISEVNEVEDTNDEESDEENNDEDSNDAEVEDQTPTDEESDENDSLPELSGDSVEDSSEVEDTNDEESDEENIDNEDESEDHTGPVPEDVGYVCEICGEEFGSSRGLKSHMSRSHK